jgi:hypothetical protein
MCRALPRISFQMLKEEPKMMDPELEMEPPLVHAATSSSGG